MPRGIDSRRPGRCERRPPCSRRARGPRSGAAAAKSRTGGVTDGGMGDRFPWRRRGGSGQGPRESGSAGQARSDALASIRGGAPRVGTPSGCARASGAPRPGAPHTGATEADGIAVGAIREGAAAPGATGRRAAILSNADRRGAGAWRQDRAPEAGAPPVGAPHVGALRAPALRVAAQQDLCPRTPCRESLRVARPGAAGPPSRRRRARRLFGDRIAPPDPRRLS